MDLVPTADTDYVFDLISPITTRREAALARAEARIAEFRRAQAQYNEAWFAAGRTLDPTDPMLAAELTRAQAAMAAAHDQTLAGILGEFIHWGTRPDDRDWLAPYAVLFLQWENAYPEDWRRTHLWGSPWDMKKTVLQRFAALGVPHDLQDDVVALILRAIGREHRCEDQRYPAVARKVDGPLLRSGLAAAADSQDATVRRRASWVSWVVDHPDAPVTAAGWRRWLAEDPRRAAQPSDD